MAKAIFIRPFNYTSRLRNAGWSAKAADYPQRFPREFIQAAISAGCAVEVRRDQWATSPRHFATSASMVSPVSTAPDAVARTMNG